MGPIVLGTALNPLNDHPRLPLSEDDVDDNLDINAQNSTIANELAVFEPDEEFEASQREMQAVENKGAENI